MCVCKGCWGCGGGGDKNKAHFLNKYLLKTLDNKCGLSLGCQACQVEEDIISVLKIFLV